MNDKHLSYCNWSVEALCFNLKLKYVYHLNKSNGY